jgi:hypothetical protein
MVVRATVKGVVVRTGVTVSVINHYNTSSTEDRRGRSTTYDRRWYAISLGTS